MCTMKKLNQKLIENKEKLASFQTTAVHIETTIKYLKVSLFCNVITNNYFHNSTIFITTKTSNI